MLFVKEPETFCTVQHQDLWHEPALSIPFHWLWFWNTNAEPGKYEKVNRPKGCSMLKHRSKKRQTANKAQIHLPSLLQLYIQTHTTNPLEGKQLQSSMTNYSLRLQTPRKRHYSTCALQNEGRNFQRWETLQIFICLQHCMRCTNCLQLRTDLFISPTLLPAPKLRTCFIPLTRA